MIRHASTEGGVGSGDSHHQATHLTDVDLLDDESAEADAAEVDADADDASPTESATPTARRGRLALLRVTAYVVLPVLALSLAGVAAYFKYQDATASEVDHIRTQSVQTAMEDTAALLSYTPDSVEAKLDTASDRLTGPFRDSYLALVRDTVIPGARQKQITAVATVPAGSSVTASRDHAKVMVFVNQTTTVGADVPTQSASVVEVSLDKVDGRWLISGFEPK